MENYRNHLINHSCTVKDALKKLDQLASDAIAFIVNDDEKLLGSITDGDFRRGFLSGLGFDDLLMKFVQPKPKFIRKQNVDIPEIAEYRKNNLRILPVLDANGKVVNIVNFRVQKSYLPLDAVVMAGGRGKRLKPLTDTTPKPLLQVGEKPIIDHCLDNLRDYGIDDIWISVGYLGGQIKSYLGDGNNASLRIRYIEEEKPLGTAGSLSRVSDLNHDHFLLMNADLLTDLNIEEFYLKFLKENADMAVACIPFDVNVPYAVLNTEENSVINFEEKPTYRHACNAGIYLLKKSVLEFIPKETSFDATDLMQELLSNNKKVITFDHNGYWIDIGKPADYQRAQKEIKLFK